MGYARSQVQDTGMMRLHRNGDGWLSALSETIQNTDSNQVLTASAMSGGLYTRGGMTAGRTDTTDTAVAILAALPQMDIGDNFIFTISVQVAFALTLAAGVGVTLAGKTSVPASGFGTFMLTRTAAATVQVKGL